MFVFSDEFRLVHVTILFESTEKSVKMEMDEWNEEKSCEMLLTISNL